MSDASHRSSSKNAANDAEKTSPHDSAAASASDFAAPPAAPPASSSDVPDWLEACIATEYDQRCLILSTDLGRDKMQELKQALRSGALQVNTIWMHESYRPTLLKLAATHGSGIDGVFLDACWLNQSHVPELAVLLSGFRPLRQLAIRDCPHIGDLSLQCMGELFKLAASTLTVLQLENCGLTADGIAWLATAQIALPALHTMRLDKNKLGLDEQSAQSKHLGAATALSRLLSLWPSLTRLGLCSAGLTGEQAADLARGIGQHGALQTIDLSRNSLVGHSTSMKHLAEGFSDCSTLREITFNKVKAGRTGLASLRAAIEANSSITRVQLDPSMHSEEARDIVIDIQRILALRNGDEVASPESVAASSSHAASVVPPLVPSHSSSTAGVTAAQSSLLPSSAAVAASSPADFSSALPIIAASQIDEKEEGEAEESDEPAASMTGAAMEEEEEEAEASVYSDSDSEVEWPAVVPSPQDESQQQQETDPAASAPAAGVDQLRRQLQERDAKIQSLEQLLQQAQEQMRRAALDHARQIGTLRRAMKRCISDMQSTLTSADSAASSAQRSDEPEPKGQQADEAKEEQAGKKRRVMPIANSSGEEK